jgi:glutathione S-transferase
MILIGMFDSPFVRRVGVTLHLLGIPFEHRNWSVGKDFDRIREFNPLGRVPALVLPDGDVLIESAAILDFIDDSVGADRALLPRAGVPRREALRVMAIAAGAAEKGVLQIYERVFRPEEKWHEAWVERCSRQMTGALVEMERLAAFAGGGGGDWLVTDRMTQADVTVACVFGFLNQVLTTDPHGSTYPCLSALSARCEGLPAFQSVRADFHPPA